MKRDMNLIREMLLDIEATPANTLYELNPSAFNGCGMPMLQRHAQLLEEAGLVESVVLSRSGGSIGGLTWAGHDFLDAARSDTNWAKALKKFAEVGGGMTMVVLKELLNHYLRESLGLA